jgi:hypothetical protein
MSHPKLLNHELTYYIYMVKMKTPLFHDGFLGVNTEPGAGVVPPPPLSLRRYPSGATRVPPSPLLYTHPSRRRRWRELSGKARAVLAAVVYPPTACLEGPMGQVSPLQR